MAAYRVSRICYVETEQPIDFRQLVFQSWYLLHGGAMDASDVSNVRELCPLSVAFSGLRDLVLSTWLVRVRKEIPTAACLDDPTLTNNLPMLYDNIAEALTVGYPRAYATPGTNLAYAHGRDRANLSGYSPGDVVHELHLFDEVIIEVAGAAGLHLGLTERATIDKSIDNAVRESVSAFTSTTLEIGQMFFASLCHDIRNPLNVVSSYAQLIRRKTANSDIVLLTERMNARLTEVDAMLQTLLDATVLNGRQKLNLDIAQFDLKSLVEETCADMFSETNSYVITGDRIVGFWCRTAMKRALQNLLSNAQKYGQSGTGITVHLSRVDHRVFLSVHNEGLPIPPGDIERMFSAFQRLGGIDVKGWGLGLPFVRNVAESHAGTVIVDSAPERGTTFTISVPLDCRDCRVV